MGHKSGLNATIFLLIENLCLMSATSEAVMKILAGKQFVKF
jgi:hypothetical protein